MKIVSALCLGLLVACGSSAGSGGDDDDDFGSGADGGPTGSDVTECNNGIDDDGDGLVDGLDPECVSSLDDDEGSFATGIPGDNIDAVKQDCFFDGDSGHGNDGCLLHTCCLLEGECPEDLRPDQFDPDDCTPSQDCIDFCSPITPPGCDCFGCCTMCEGDTCRDILINTEVAPDCDTDTFLDPEACPACVKVDECGPPGDDCTDLECNLCPGQTPEDLPPECESPECPAELEPCATSEDCPAGKYCSIGCCINEIG